MSTPSKTSSPVAPFRIAMVAACPFPFDRGTPARVLCLSEALARRGHDVHVITYHLGEDTNLQALRLHRIRDVPGYKKTGPGPSVKKLLVVDSLLTAKLVSVLRDIRFDVIHAHHYEGLGVALLARRLARQRTPGAAVPIVYDAHTLLGAELPYYGIGLSGGHGRRALGRLIDRRLPALADATIAVSEEIAATLVSSVLASRLYVIGNGVEGAFFKDEPSTVDAHEIDRRLVYAGNFARYQRVDLMLLALREVVAQRPDVRLRVVSTDPVDNFLVQARQIGVRSAIDVIAAPLKELPAELRRARIALNPRTECPGLPQKLLNYLAAGRAVVSFAGSAQAVHHGETALVVPDGDVAAFASAILSLLDDPAYAYELGARARQYMCEEHSWDRKAELTERVYENVRRHWRSSHN